MSQQNAPRAGEPIPNASKPDDRYDTDFEREGSKAHPAGTPRRGGSTAQTGATGEGESGGRRELHGGFYGGGFYGQGDPRNEQTTAPHPPILSWHARHDVLIHEDVCEALTHDDVVDASDVTVEVHGGEVVLDGTVATRHEKRRAERLADGVRGVRDVMNLLRVRNLGPWEPLRVGGRTVPNKVRLPRSPHEDLFPHAGRQPAPA